MHRWIARLLRAWSERLEPKQQVSVVIDPVKVHQILAEAHAKRRIGQTQ